MVNFLKNRKALYSKIVRSAVLSGSLFLCCSSTSFAEEIKTDSENSEKEERSQLVGLQSTFLRRSVLAGPPDGTDLYLPDTSMTGLLKKHLIVTGTVRFITIYRNMDKSYGDMLTSNKNISFLDYPQTNVGTVSTGGFPVLEINLGTRALRGFNFNVGYSFSHSFSGQTDNDKARNLSSRQNLFITGTYNSDIANISLSAGGILWTSLSRFTMGQAQYRDNYFERLPWDWYRQSFLRFDEYYSYNTNLGSEAAGRSPVQGFVGAVDFYKAGVVVTGMFGRTNRNVGAANSTNHFPSYTSAVRVEKNIFTRYLDGRFGLNVYTRNADTDKSRGIKDFNQIISVDGKLKVRRVTFLTEVAKSRMINPGNKNGVGGFAFYLKSEFDKRASPIPFSAEIYQVGHNVFSADGSIIGSRNPQDDGYITDYLYDLGMMINFNQEVGQIASNRRGLSLNGEAQVGKLKINLGIAVSQELDNRNDTITIQHRVNSFSRSRFRPWFMAGGPYSRIKSGWRKTFETLTITDSVSDYKKGFNGVELLFKYKFFFLGKDVVVLNFYNFNSTQDHFSPIPEFGSKAFVRTAYTDLTIAYKLAKKYTISLHGGIEKVLGGTRINLADASGAAINGTDGRPAYSPTGKTIDQTGWVAGVGIDYDFSSTAGLHLRHTFMSHKDKNFVLDTFQGQETTFELKIFF